MIPNVRSVQGLLSLTNSVIKDANETADLVSFCYEMIFINFYGLINVIDVYNFCRM